MNISFNRLASFLEIDKSPKEISELLTAAGLEVEGMHEYEEIKGSLEGLVIGEVTACEKHPNADKLKLTKTNVGAEELLSIVCGAPNVAVGQKVIVAPVGAVIYPNGEPLKMKRAKIRGEVSEGMICAEDELGLGSAHDGIIVLDTELPPGTPAAAYFKPGKDCILDIALTPNRGDAASHLGVARDLSVLLDRPFKLPSVQAFKSDHNKRAIPVTVENKEACPRYSSITIENITVKESPQWLKSFLISIGTAPVNNVVDITNFVLHDLGQPLHAFDADKITGGQVIVKTLPEGTPFTTLDQTERKLRADDLMICNTKAPMCIAGVFGGINSGITEETKAVFLESAYFSADSVRKTALAHGLKTDASFRFERGTDPAMTAYALKRAALLIKELAGGIISSDVSDLYPVPVKPHKITLRYDHVERLIGEKIDAEIIKKFLIGLEIKIEAETKETLELEVPSYRYDVQREADVIEEILRFYGFDNLKTAPNLYSTFLAHFPKKDTNKLRSSISELLAANGYSEMMNNSLTRSSYSSPEEAVSVLNPLSEELNVMRSSMLFSGLETLAYNINRRQKNLKFFEFGKTYRKKENEYTESSRLALFITGGRNGESWREKFCETDIYDLGAAVEKITQKLGWKPKNESPSEQGIFKEGITLSSEEEIVVEYGEVHPEILNKLNISQPVWFADINWEALLSVKQENTHYLKISKFPEVRRDLSLVLDKKITFREIRLLAEKTERKLLSDVNVFDIYEGKNIEDNKRSYSVSFILKDDTKTLTDKQIDKTLQNLISAYEQELGAVIRR